jgi:hypothetical protein
MKIGKDVLQLVFVTEKIQADLRDGETLSTEEALLVRHAITELLDAVPAPESAIERDDQTLFIPFVS